ncbi:MAG: hypothetical protein H0U74_17505 [Bradymonadaceae bacterium]|nr:hypothetical protein [Lujinxingiaceae bacterium]
MSKTIKGLLVACTFALASVSVQAWACDGHADKGAEASETTTTATAKTTTKTAKSGESACACESKEPCGCAKKSEAKDGQADKT